MKQKIRLTDKITGKVLEGETEVRNLMHFNIQRNTRAHVFIDRRKRDPKYKKNLLEVY